MGDRLFDELWKRKFQAFHHFVVHIMSILKNIDYGKCTRIRLIIILKNLDYDKITRKI